MRTEIKERYEFIYLLKAMAIFSVVLYHFNNLRMDLVEYENGFTYFNYFIQSICSIGVPVFFFVNGALLLNKGLDLKKHVIKILRLTILTVVWGVLTLLILMPVNKEYMSFYEFAVSLFTWRTHWINHLWFLKALVVIYTFFPLIKLAYDGNRAYLYFFLSVTFILTFGNVILSNIANIFEFVIGVNYLKGNANFFGEFNAFKGIYGYSIVYFIVGGLCFEKKKLFLSRKWVVTAVVALPVSMLLLSSYGVLMTKSNAEFFDTVWYGYDSIPTLCMVIALFILSIKYTVKKPMKSIVNIIADNSFGIYLTHMIWGSLFIKYFKQLSHTENIITNIVLAVIVTCMSLVSVMIIKKIPVAKKLLIL